ncbi:TonB-dependent receptor plug domain-containing protein [Opitutus sp. GAS368]|jgi:outer membrane receptor protein involved in Fe transport|uniref:TonB-dependent siderophore receptor n=1 Tax=Opitutus sp. GAS368 TaxID=1882749 RepID=UPI00087C88AD|nr:TonB-dependent receptor plug domain-containing protein [Opitutus sp. GAS368]SDR85213.1 TonB-dependent Receptor Plug Domain [Opitutus sp. GAS368]
MIPTNTPSTRRASKLLAVGLAALVTSSAALAQSADSDALRRLQDENATLRKRLAEIEAQSHPAAAASATPTSPVSAATSAARPATAAEPQDKETYALSPFEVKSGNDYGYLKTNAATATRIGMAIQNVPMNISVMSEDFLKDTGVQSITDILRYTSSGSPDSRFAMRVPGNSATPQGNFTLRGFTVNSLLRDGIFRYSAYNLDNVDRVEIVKGPAAVFFGQGYPGGVINYITKKPLFDKPIAAISYAVMSNAGQKVTVDYNAPMAENAAFRVVGAWADQKGFRTGEFHKNYNFTPSLTLNPFKSGKLHVNLELEHLTESYNANDSAWLYPQGWFDAYKNPSAALIAAAPASVSGAADPIAAYRARIFNSLGNYMADVRKAANDPGLPIYTQSVVSPYASYTDLNGNRVQDKHFNFTNSGAFSSNEVNTFTATVDFSPFSWLDARYVYTKDNDRFNNIFAQNAPNADGMTFNAASGGGGNGYYRRTQDHQIDVIVKADFLGIKNKFLFGGVYSQPFQQYMASIGAVYYAVPGYNYPANNPNNLPSPGSMVPVLQVLKDRNGNILTAQQVYSMWDPSVQIQPPVSKIYNINRNLLDGYRSTNTALYLNWQGTALKDDKLTMLGGYRREGSKGFGQNLTSNDPWFVVPNTAYLDQANYPPGVYNYSPSYAGDPQGFRTVYGDSWMGGVSYAITKEVSVYATVSKTFKLNTGSAGGYDTLGINNLLNDALTNNGGSFSYRGQTITSVAQGLAAIEADGANKPLNNESGKNFEVGVKTALWNNQLVTTFSLFRGIRQDQKLDDSNAQANVNEPFNYSTTMFAPTSPYYNTRNFRWRAVGVKNQITGTDFDITWTPNRNYQAVINGAYMWQAATIDNPLYAHPGSTAYNNAAVATQIFDSMYYGNRIENVPEYRLNVFNKYTFTTGAARGLSLALGARYSSKTVVSRSIDWNPDRGGFQAGNYCVFDGNISYPWEVLGYRMVSSLGVTNLTDKVYYEGNYAPADPRSWTLRTSVNF